MNERSRALTTLQAFVRFIENARHGAAALSYREVTEEGTQVTQTQP